jgi:hypothetical protein
LEERIDCIFRVKKQAKPANCFSIFNLEYGETSALSKLHGIATLKTVIFAVTAVRTSNPKF